MDPMIQNLLPVFFKTREKDLHLIKQALNAKNFEQLKDLGHKVKGSSLNYDFKNLGLMGKELEDAATTKDMSSCKKIYRNMLTEVKKERIHHLSEEP